MSDSKQKPVVVVRTSQFPRELLEKAYREIQAKKAELAKKTGS